MMNFYFKDELLRIVNLAPKVDINNIEKVHPMKQITIMAIIQVLVFFGMLAIFYITDGYLETNS